MYTATQSKKADDNSYQFATVTHGKLEQVISSTGTIAAVGTVTVGTQISGTIEKVFVDYNDKVKKGQVLAVLDRSLYQATVVDAEATLKKAKAECAQSETELVRHKPLYEKGYISEQEYLPYETDVETKKATVTSAESAVKRARTSLEYTVIRSPINGTVISRSVDSGQTVAASLNTPTLFQIAEDLSKMQIEVSVDESDIGQVRLGQAVRFTVQSYPDNMFSGTVTQIRLNPTTVQNVVNYKIIVKAANDDGLLLPGMTATADFVVKTEKDALLVPNQALAFKPLAITGGQVSSGKETEAKDDKGTLYVLDTDNRIKPVKVTPGISDGTITVVHGEIHEGR